MTRGQKLVGLTFNPSNDLKVQKIKELYAEIIDMLESGYADSGDGTAMYAHAREYAITAQMWAVKAVTFKDV